LNLTVPIGRKFRHLFGIAGQTFTGNLVLTFIVLSII